MSDAGTWLFAFEQFVKQKKRISQCGHMRVEPSQSTRRSTHLCAKWLAQVSPVFSLHELGGEPFLISIVFFCVLALLLFSEVSGLRSFHGLSASSPAFDGITGGLANVRGSAVLKVQNCTLSIRAEKLMIESSKNVLSVSVMHSSSHSWKCMSIANKNMLINLFVLSRDLKLGLGLG